MGQGYGAQAGQPPPKTPYIAKKVETPECTGLRLWTLLGEDNEAVKGTRLALLPAALRARLRRFVTCARWTDENVSKLRLVKSVTPFFRTMVVPRGADDDSIFFFKSPYELWLYDFAAADDRKYVQVPKEQRCGLCKLAGDVSDRYFVVSVGNCIRVLDLKRGKPIREIAAHKQPIAFLMALSITSVTGLNNIVASVSIGNEGIKLWNIDTGEQVQHFASAELARASERIRNMNFVEVASTGAKYLIAAQIQDEQHFAAAFDLATGTTKQVLGRGAPMSADGSRVVLLSMAPPNIEACLWNMTNFQCERKISFLVGMGVKPNLIPHRSKIIQLTAEKLVLNHLDTGVKQELALESGSFVSLTYSNGDEDLLFVMTRDAANDVLRVIDCNACKVVKRVEIEGSAACYDIKLKGNKLVLLLERAEGDNKIPYLELYELL